MGNVSDVEKPGNVEAYKCISQCLRAINPSDALGSDLEHVAALFRVLLLLWSDCSMMLEIIDRETTNREAKIAEALAEVRKTVIHARHLVATRHKMKVALRELGEELPEG